MCVQIATVATPVHLVIRLWCFEVNLLMTHVTQGYVYLRGFMAFLSEQELEALVLQVFAHLLCPPSLVLVVLVVRTA